VTTRQTPGKHEAEVPAAGLVDYTAPPPVVSLHGGGGGGFSLGGVHYIQARNCWREDDWVRVQIVEVSPTDLVLVDETGTETRFGMPRGADVLPVLGFAVSGRHATSGLYGHLSPAWRCVFLTAAGSLDELGPRPGSSVPVRLTADPEDGPSR
jgi:hypothetical protein